MSEITPINNGNYVGDTTAETIYSAFSRCNTNFFRLLSMLVIPTKTISGSVTPEYTLLPTDNGETFEVDTTSAAVKFIMDASLGNTNEPFVICCRRSSSDSSVQPITFEDGAGNFIAAIFSAASNGTGYLVVGTNGTTFGSAGVA